ncbi:LamG domain-containing protein [Mucilaginibacter terrenus]|uniref:LamG domain-containing protein n=1 Tax=Mucilaginibacter terrenus TaxID=2482727 RepID=A0A3E2NQF1_9SPHI|nr:LamG-like jellyroll fold domain-containing protein [Mucilaginibacter terrenus]RFZ83203.1 LamG domain-containing protein [Mucilaginibacter terrenus]
MKNITKTIGAILLCGTAACVALTGCQEKANDYRPDKPVPKIEGYNSAAEVAAPNLVSYWPFNSTVTDSVGNLTGTATKTTFDAGVKGQGFKGDAAGFIIYGSPGATIPAMKNFTLSFWVNAQKPGKDDPARGIFSLNNNKDFWGNLDVYLDGYRSLDTMNIKVHINNDAVNWKGQFTNALIANPWGKWTHITATYNDTTSVFNVYANGEAVAVSSAGNSTVIGPKLHGDDPAKGDVPYGPLKFVNASAMVMGSWQFQTTPPQTTSASAQTWAQGFAGGLDNFRIYGKSLSAKEVKALYLLEKAGR